MTLSGKLGGHVYGKTKYISSFQIFHFTVGLVSAPQWLRFLFHSGFSLNFIVV